jgi:hypothetical protein
MSPSPQRNSGSGKNRFKIFLWSKDAWKMRGSPSDTKQDVRCILVYEAKGLVMFIHEMSASECREALAHARVGRLACARDNQPYILPMNFAIDGEYLYLYGFTALGQKVEWM